MEVWPLKNPSLYKQNLECFKTSKPVSFFFYLSQTWINIECPLYLEYGMKMPPFPNHTWRRCFWTPCVLCLKPTWLCWTLRALQTWPHPAALPDFPELVDLLVWFCLSFSSLSHTHPVLAPSSIFILIRPPKNIHPFLFQPILPLHYFLYFRPFGILCVPSFSKIT